MNSQVSNKKLSVLFLIFRRKDAALKVLESIREYKPNRIYIAADGAREKEEETKLCEQTRTAVLKAIDWNCEIKTLFREQNLGCANAVYSAITWFFEHEEYGLIIEDDCIIHPDFYRLCEELLPIYKNEEKIMLITAQNHTPDLNQANKLVFTNNCFIWGWASWRRAWNKMDINMNSWPQYKFRSLIKDYGLLYGCYMYYRWNKCYNNISKVTSWATRWKFAVLLNKGLCLSSNVNLSKNIGIGEDNGTHYNKNDIDIYSHIPFGNIQWPIELPQKLEPTKEKLLAERKEFFRRMKFAIKKRLKNIFAY
jgi:hypothetical protein